MQALHTLIGPSPMLAYLVMMAARLVELHRVLKPTGSLYLHCDPHRQPLLKGHSGRDFRSVDQLRARNYLEAFLSAHQCYTAARKH